MQHLVQQAGLNWTVDSAGTGNWHVGECPDHRSTAVAKGYGVDISKQKCRQFKVSDFDEFDLLLAMDRNNLRDVQRLARNENDKAKVRLLLNDMEVPDPYYDSNQFDPVYKLIENGCNAIIEEYSSK